MYDIRQPLSSSCLVVKDCTISAIAIMASAVMLKVRNEFDHALLNRDLRPLNCAGILSSGRPSTGLTLITVDFGRESLLVWPLPFDSDAVPGSPGFQLDLRLLAVSGTSMLERFERVSKDLRVCATVVSLKEASAMLKLVSGVLSLAKLDLSPAGGWRGL